MLNASSAWPRTLLTQREIALILKSLKRLARKKNKDSEIIATAGEILSQDTEGQFERDTATDDTKVRTALLCGGSSTCVSQKIACKSSFLNARQFHGRRQKETTES